MSNRYKSMLLFGQPGVGKGTQGKILGNIPGLRHVASGDIFRSLDKQSELGKQFLHYSSRGDLVPDDLTIALWQDHMKSLTAQKQFNPAADLLLLDGIPRSTPQAMAIDQHIDVLKVIHLRCANVDEMVQRMKRRAQMEGRHDDADESVIRRRFEVYEQETAPVLSHYPRKVVTEVEALGTPADVLLRILNVVVPIYDQHFENPLGSKTVT